MHNQDYISRVMTFYRQLHTGHNEKETGPGASSNNSDGNWKELVDRVALKGMDDLELRDLIRLAELAKDILR